ncbi:hypothetical protein HPB49_020148 [Dermacentor silvarum]|uniref:Uncharacterized protein n=1 Tax=Dermacentor silvarum TaxID=543639 RepID=A0ACB8D7C0_DERSI|nr:hypothetical protein HPB49_020148 [Dermacentor silvarum]
MSTSAAPETTPILTRLSELPDNSRDSMDCQEIDAHDPPGSHEPRTQTHRTENAKQTDGDWQTVLTLRQKKALAQAKNQKRYSENAGTSTAHHTAPKPETPGHRVEDSQKFDKSKNLQLAGWYACACCGLFCVLVKFPWYLSHKPTSESVDLFLAFFDRILWSLFLAWIVLMCATGRGGTLTKFLSCNAFVPLSKLSYGVYLIHWPFIELMIHSSRERVYWSVFNQLSLSFAVLVWCFLLSYLAFIACEAPTGVLEKLLFKRLTGDGGARRQEHQE